MAGGATSLVGRGGGAGTEGGVGTMVPLVFRAILVEWKSGEGVPAKRERENISIIKDISGEVGRSGGRDVRHFLECSEGSQKVK